MWSILSRAADIDLRTQVLLVVGIVIVLYWTGIRTNVGRDHESPRIRDRAFFERNTSFGMKNVQS